MAYNTGNAPGSTDPRDLSDSSGDIDEWATSKTKLMHPDRLGVQRKTWHGMESDFAEALDSYQEQVNDIVIAGGQIFSDEATGRAAVVDDAYYLSEGDSESVATILWQRINASTSRRVADNPAVDYVSMAVQIARDAGHKLAYPNVDYALNYPVEMTVDYDFNLITAVDADGGVTSVQRHADSVVQYPNTTFSDSQMSATVDRSGGVIDSKTLRQAFGQYAAYPYQSFAETGELKKVAANGAVISDPSRWGGRVFVELYGANSDLFVAWPHGKGKMLRVNYRPNGVNNLFNWRSTEVADFGDPANANWTTIASTNSDSWPPLIFEAVNDGDGGPQIYTGGNHSSDGGTGGVPTAYMSSIEFAVDGRKLRVGEGFSGYAESVQAHWRNEIMAFNTITLDRYPITQEIRCEFYAGDISGFVSITANEPVIMGLDNGPQMFSDGYETYHYYDGQQQAALPIPTSGTNTSGVFSSYPAWACVFSNPEHGFHGAWLDREFEAGDGRYITGSAGAFRKGNGAKFYSIVVGTGDLNMATGDSYEYHGGYFWSPADAVSDGVDSAFTFHKRGEPSVGYAITSAGSGALHLPLWAEGREVAGAGVAGINGIEVSASGYTTFDPAIISSFGLRRENHVGTQPMESVEGLSAALDELSPKNNLEASVAPTASDDSTEGYRALSIWVFGTTLYRCVDATPGAAVWVDTGISAEDLGTAAFESDTKYAHRSNNLSDVDAAQARTNLGLGAAAQQPLETFDPAGAAEDAQAYAIQREHHTGTQPMDSIDGLSDAFGKRLVSASSAADIDALVAPSAQIELYDELDFKGLDVYSQGAVLQPNNQTLKNIGSTSGLRQFDGERNSLLDKPLNPQTAIQTGRKKAVFEKDGAVWCITQGGASGAGVAFEILTGNTAAPSLPSSSINVSFEYWRVAVVRAVKEAWLYRLPVAETGAWSDYTPPDADFGSDALGAVPWSFRRSQNAGNTISFSANADRRGLLRIAFFGTATTPSSQPIKVDGVVTKTVNTVDSRLWVVEIESTPGTHTIEIEHDPSGANLYVGGVNCYALSETESLDDSVVFDAVAYYSQSPSYTTNRNAHDFAFRSKTNDLWGGSYHGGHVQRAAPEWQFDGVSRDPTVPGFVQTCVGFSLKQATSVDWSLADPAYSEYLDIDDLLRFGDGQTQHLVHVEGNLLAHTFHPGMSGSSPAMTRTWGTKYSEDNSMLPEGNNPYGRTTRTTQQAPGGRGISCDFTDWEFYNSPYYGGLTVSNSPGAYNKVYYSPVRYSEQQINTATWVFTRTFH
ncbi:hypothetical protein [Stutzerimonas xanthomarina]|uniref:hypothetical protein n=1 Tax=Stutzerimonas xanthomarina TaxID=271420 RepID=UPI003AA9B087